MDQGITGKRVSQPPPRLSYYGLGRQWEEQLQLRNPEGGRHNRPAIIGGVREKEDLENVEEDEHEKHDDPIPEVKADSKKKSKSGSAKSAESKRKEVSLTMEKQLMELSHQHDDNLADLDFQEEEIRDLIEMNLSSQMADEGNRNLVTLQRQRKKLIDRFERKKRQIQEAAQLDQKFIDLEDDDDGDSQYLGSDEETAAKVKTEDDKQSFVTAREPVPKFGFNPGARSFPYRNVNREPIQSRNDRRGNFNYETLPRTQDPMTQLAVALDRLGRQGGGGGRDKWLPEFNGDPAQWCNFLATYERTTKKFNIEDGENMTRLQGALKGDARAAVLHLFANVHNVDRIMLVLKRRFGRPELVLDYLVERAKACKAPDISKPATLVEFGTTVEALVTNICAFEENEYMYNKQLITELVKKMPVTLQEKWYGWLIEDSSRKPNLHYFSEWLEVQTRIAELRIVPEVNFSSELKWKRGTRRDSAHVAVEDDDTKPTCVVCGKQNHKPDKCFFLKKKDIDDRWEAVKSKRLCFTCLGENHITKKCPSPKECGIEGCSYKHHPLLHRKYKSYGISKSSSADMKKEHAAAERDDKQKSKGNDSGDGSFNVAEDSVNWSIRAGSLAMIPVELTGPAGKKKVYAFLDSGASTTMITDDLANELGLEKRQQPYSYVVFEGKKRNNVESSFVNVGIRGVHEKNVHQLSEIRTMKKLGVPKMSLNVDMLKENYPHLRRMKLSSFRDKEPQILIGNDYFRLHAPRVWLENKRNQDAPVGCKGLLGWYVANTKADKASCEFLAMALAEEDDHLHEMIKDFFSVENFGVKYTANSHRSKEDKVALAMMEANTVKKDGRWETSLLWKEEGVKMPESKSTALRNLKFMERKMHSDAALAELCVAKFEDYIAKGYLREKVVKQDESKRYYLPWFFQFHPTKKPRLVFNAAAKTNGKCFNDFLMKGPDLLRPLPAVLMRFRSHVVAVTADIKEMFHQVALCEDDIKSQTILYRGRNSPIMEYEMTRLFFGSTCSPSSAIFAKNTNAAEFVKIYPDAVKAIEQDFFMDDFLSGAETEAAAIKLQQQVTEIHESGGFPIVKWNSNSDRVLSAISPDIRANENLKITEKSALQPEKTLGLYWEAHKDEFCFNMSFHRVKKEVAEGLCNPTKRQVTSLVMAIFDPLGFLAPLKIKGLMLIQEIWRSGVDWDEEIPLSIFEDWKSWLKELDQVNKIRVPRPYCAASMKKAESIQLHIFCDGSESGYASCAFLRIQTGESLIVKFVMGKCRVAPLKGLSVPRMELQAALLGSRLAQSLKEAHRDQFQIDKIVFWTDSRTVLCWVRSTTGRFAQFVSTRIGEIMEISDPKSWRWVPTAQNVADDATRFVKNLEYHSKSRWLTGSSFLLKVEEDWPKEKKVDVPEEVLERKDSQFDVVNVCSNVTGSREDLKLPDIGQFSSWHRLIRATAARYWAARKFMKKGPQYITTDDMKKAKVMWIKESQKRSFPTELKLLQNGKQIEQGSRIFSFSPALNEDRVIVMQGRLSNADISDEVKYPPILDPEEPYTKLMIEWFHRTSQHFGQERIINELRKHAWILRCRVAVRKCKSECMICRKKAAKPNAPLMGQLPGARIENGNAPFHHTGVDYFGPYYVKIRRGTEKRWGVLFTCLTTRAVHLELAESLDTSDFINALVRFMNLRGKPAHIWSDNGTNLVGGEREIRESLAKWNQDEMRRCLGVKAIQWHFIPPSSPHMGGSWERLVGVAKKILSHLLKEQEPKESVLRTLFTEVTFIMNSRPITRASPDPDDLRCLTPNDLLNVKCVVAPSVPGLYESGDRYRKSWRQAQTLASDFWKRWSEEYLPWLAKREKWLKPAKPLEIGDVVLVLEDYAPRNSWKMGKVVDTFPAKDGQVRSVEVLVTHVDPKDPKKVVKYSALRRPVMKICPLSP